MKKLIIIISLFTAVSIFAQYNSLRQNEGVIGGGAGVTWINGQPFYSIHINPEIAFANFGVGLDLNLEFGADGNLRTENFNEFSDYASIIRYVRYGQKHDPVYARLGALDYASLGHGSIMYLYNNSPSYDTRKIGLEFDIDFSTFGFESVYGSFGEAGVAGLRGYVRPIQFTQLASTPIIGQLEVGATFAGDFNDKAGVISGAPDPITGEFKASFDEGSTSIVGFDLGLPIIRTSVVGVDLYFDYASIVGFGSGTAAGVKMGFSGLGLVTLQAKLERRFNGDNYLPSYFNAMYEIQRFNLNESTGVVNSKIQNVKFGSAVGDGFYGELLVDVLGVFDILGSYQRLDDHPQSGMLHLSSNISPEGSSYVLRAGYDKVNIIDESDLFKLDDRSYLFAEAGYKPIEYILVSLVYNWTFTPVRDGGDNVIDYVPQKKIEPRVTFIYPFNVGG
ncbi:MAG: hypothetical protein K9H06_09920 [Melioribacteraceae bacterium]|nr:hypothetical protein [Melioribacteraceae bacterium]